MFSKIAGLFSSPEKARPEDDSDDSVVFSSPKASPCNSENGDNISAVPPSQKSERKQSISPRKLRPSEQEKRRASLSSQRSQDAAQNNEASDGLIDFPAPRGRMMTMPRSAPSEFPKSTQRPKFTMRASGSVDVDNKSPLCSWRGRESQAGGLLGEEPRSKSAGKTPTNNQTGSNSSSKQQQLSSADVSTSWRGESTFVRTSTQDFRTLSVNHSQSPEPGPRMCRRPSSSATRSPPLSTLPSKSSILGDVPSEETTFCRESMSSITIEAQRANPGQNLYRASTNLLDMPEKVGLLGEAPGRPSTNALLGGDGRVSVGLLGDAPPFGRSSTALLGDAPFGRSSTALLGDAPFGRSSTGLLGDAPFVRSNTALLGDMPSTFESRYSRNMQSTASILGEMPPRESTASVQESLAKLALNTARTASEGPAGGLCRLPSQRSTSETGERRNSIVDIEPSESAPCVIQRNAASSSSVAGILGREPSLSTLRHHSSNKFSSSYTEQSLNLPYSKTSASDAAMPVVAEHGLLDSRGSVEATVRKVTRSVERESTTVSNGPVGPDGGIGFRRARTLQLVGCA